LKNDSPKLLIMKISAISIPRFIFHSLILKNSKVLPLEVYLLYHQNLKKKKKKKKTHPNFRSRIEGIVKKRNKNCQFSSDLN